MDPNSLGYDFKLNSILKSAVNFDQNRNNNANSKFKKKFRVLTNKKAFSNSFN